MDLEKAIRETKADFSEARKEKFINSFSNDFEINGVAFTVQAKEAGIGNINGYYIKALVYKDGKKISKANLEKLING